MRSSRLPLRERSPETSTPGPFQGVQLGPATVIEVGAGEVRAILQSGEEATLQLALAFLYRPSVGDVVLAISQEEAHYAIGVLHAEASPGISVVGDLSLRAVGGKLKLVGDEGVVVQTSGEASIQAGSLRTVAGSVVERLASVTRWVSGQVSLRAGEVTRLIEGTETTQSKRSFHVAEETIKVDSNQVHLGH